MFEALQAFMDALTAWRIPGNSASVCVDGKEVFRCRSGFRCVEQQIPMDGSERFFIFSCSKIATVTAALQLYERGYFLLDDPLYDILPEYRRMAVRASDGTLRETKTPVTLRHLFTMTAGLTYDAGTLAFEKARRITGGKMQTREVIRCLAEDPLSFEPGTRWQYSLCHDVLACVVEVVSGMRFADYMQKHLFDPLGMTRTGYHPESAQSEIAELYHFRNSDETRLADQQAAGAVLNQADGVLENVGKRNPDIYGEAYDSGGSGVITTVGDYSRLCAALACGGYSAVTGAHILSPGTVELLHTNQLSPAQAASMHWEQLRGYGYGLGVRTMIDKARSGSVGPVGEFGWGGAAGATALMDTQNRVSLFYTHHMLNPQESYYQPRLRNVLYGCLKETRHSI